MQQKPSICDGDDETNLDDEKNIKAMAQGNCYLVIPKTDKKNNIPEKIKAKYGWLDYTYDDDGEVISSELVHPTWEALMMQKGFRNRFGGSIETIIEGVEYDVIELELDMISAPGKPSEFDVVQGLQNGKPYPEYRLMSASEAQQFVDGVDLEP